MAEMAKRIAAIERRQAVRSGNVGVPLVRVPRGPTPDQRQRWREEIDQTTPRPFILHVAPFPPRTVEDVQELLEMDGISAPSVLESARSMNNTHLEAEIRNWQARNG